MLQYIYMKSHIYADVKGMMIVEEKWLNEFSKEVAAFAEAAKKFDSGEIDRKEYKGISGGLGSYAQHDPRKHMLRLRMAGGSLTKERLGFIADSIAKYGIDKMKMTTCETIQFHDLAPASLPELMLDAVRADIFTKGGGGDNPRNVMVSPLTGVQEGECFDVLPFAEASAMYLLSICREIKMPRKLKIAFCNGVDDCCHSAFRDMGFLAQPDGTFRLRIAGGLGASSPKQGVEVIEALEPCKILYAIRAMIDTFCQHGCYTNRAKARTRFMQDSLGAEGLTEAFLTNFDARISEGGLELDVKPQAVLKTGQGEIEDVRVIPQKQHGLYVVKYHPIGGLLPSGKPAQLLEVIRNMDQVSCRIAPDESLYIINLTAKEAAEVLAVTSDGAVTPFEHSVACIGSSICQQGVRDSQAVLRKCVEAVRSAGLDADALPKIAICGCPSSCAAPQAAALGLMGAAKNGQSAFRIFLGGTDTLGKAKFGDFIATVYETDLPAMFVELGKAGFSSLSDAQVKEIIGKYN